MNNTPRTTAVKILNEVLQERHSLTASLHQYLKQSENQKALVQELCYGVLRWHLRLDSLIKKLVKKPLKAKEFDIHILLLIGFYQLLYLRIPEHAAVMETVNAAKQLNKQWAVPFLNGVFRNFLRHKDDILNQLTTDEVVYSHPDWLIKKIKYTWPNNWSTILTANNHYPPLALRINLQKNSRVDYCKKLEENNIAYELFPYNDCGVLITKPVDVFQLPGFSQGEVSVQDFAAQLSLPLLDLKPNLKVLDACAAPGGKTCHIIEAEPLLTQVIAVDIDKDRVTKIQENLQRLNLSACVVVADATTPSTWWDGELFDRILLDAPCSATGVIRRHPDIKYLRRQDDIAQLVQLQRTLLKSMWHLLKPGGLLVYTTCSILPEENQENLQWFLQENLNAEAEIINADWGHEVCIGRQILPGEYESDGFYYAVLIKTV